MKWISVIIFFCFSFLLFFPSVEFCYKSAYFKDYFPQKSTRKIKMSNDALIWLLVCLVAFQSTMIKRWLLISFLLFSILINYSLCKKINIFPPPFFVLNRWTKKKNAYPFFFILLPSIFFRVLHLFSFINTCKCFSNFNLKNLFQ